MIRFTRIGGWIISGVLITGLGGCDLPASTGSTTPVTLTVGVPSSDKARPDALAAVPVGVASIRLEVTAGDMETIAELFNVSDGETVTRVLDVPSGPARLFTATAYDGPDATGVVRYQGQSSPVDLAAGVPATVVISMQLIPDFTPPTVVSTDPVDGSAGVEVLSPVLSVRFSEAMDPASITSATFTLNDSANNPVAGTVGYSGATATFTPSIDLAYSTTYTAGITTGALDLAGNALASDYLWSFTTRPVPGALDPAFGTNGIATTAVGSDDDIATAMAIQPDGKIVVGGYSFNGAQNDFALTRYNSDGSPDAGFGTNGIVTTAIGLGAFATAVGVQPDGKIVAAGYSYQGSSYVFALARTNADGSPDAGFGINGIVTTAVGISADIATALEIQSDGKLVVGGYSFNGINNDIAVARYNADGSPDAGFGINGIVTTAIALGSTASALKIQSDGKIVVAGDTLSGLSNDFALVRYNPDGSPDTGFGTGGIVITAVGTGADGITAVAIQPDGRILAAGHVFFGAGYHTTLTRYNTDGGLDGSFGSAGILVQPFGSAVSSPALTLQANGKIVVTRPVFPLGSRGGDFALFRYHADGGADLDFGTGGIVTTAIRDGDIATAVAVQTDGKIVAAGYAGVNGLDDDFAVARYWP